MRTVYKLLRLIGIGLMLLALALSSPALPPPSVVAHDAENIEPGGRCGGISLRPVLGEPPKPALFLTPETAIKPDEGVFTLTLRGQTGETTAADEVQAALTFDPAALEVVDANGTPTTAVPLDTTTFNEVITSTVDNAAGHIDLAATRTISPALSGIFTIGTIRFRPKSTVISTTVTFAISGTRRSDLLLDGESLQPELDGSTLTITSDMVLTGWIMPQQRGEEGDPRWQTDLFRTTPDGIVDGITIFETETENVIDTFAATTDAFGEFSVALSGIAPGTYDVQVKGATTLSMRLVGAQLPLESEMFFGMLPTGDSTGDDTIDAQDTAFIEERLLTTVEDDAYSRYADLTGDGVVDGADISALVPAFGASGPIMIMSALAQQSHLPASQIHPSNTSGLAMNPDRVAAQAGEIITVDIVATTGAGIADTVDAYLNFDPRLLEVVDATGTPTASIELNTDLFDRAIVNTVDNTSGQIDLSASVFDTPYLEGDFTVATARFRARVAIDALALGFAQGGVRASNIYRFGESVSPVLTNIGEPPELEPCIVCLPLVVR